jgi:hypothetical protein
VKQVLLRADGEFLSWESVEAAIGAGFQFIIANKRCNPPFESSRWYQPYKRQEVEFNSCTYQPIGWDCVCRFVAMRIPKRQEQPSREPLQRMLFKDDNYTYRIFCTSLLGKAHEIIAEYDKRADVENLVGEAKREGLEMIPSTKFKNNYAFFQIVMLAYNIWRYMKMIAHKSLSQGQSTAERNDVLKGIVRNTVRIARLKLLFIAAKVVKDGNVDKVKYSIHDARTPAMMHVLKFLDKAREKLRIWQQGGICPQRFANTT